MLRPRRRVKDSWCVRRWPIVRQHTVERRCACRKGSQAYDPYVVMVACVYACGSGATLYPARAALRAVVVQSRQHVVCCCWYQLTNRGSEVCSPPSPHQAYVVAGPCAAHSVGSLAASVNTQHSTRLPRSAIDTARCRPGQRGLRAGSGDRGIGGSVDASYNEPSLGSSNHVEVGFGCFRILRC